MKREKVDKSFLRGTQIVRYPLLHTPSLPSKNQTRKTIQMHQQNIFMITKSIYKNICVPKSESNVIFIQMHIFVMLLVDVNIYYRKYCYYALLCVRASS